MDILEPLRVFYYYFKLHLVIFSSRLNNNLWSYQLCPTAGFHLSWQFQRVDQTGKSEKTQEFYLGPEFFDFIAKSTFSLLYLPFTPIDCMHIGRKVPFQEIFNTCCVNLKQYNFV